MPSTPPTDRIMTRAEKRRLETEWNDTEPTRRGSREGSGDEARRRLSVDTNGTPFDNAEYTDPPVIPRRRTRRNAGTGVFFVDSCRQVLSVVSLARTCRVVQPRRTLNDSEGSTLAPRRSGSITPLRTNMRPNRGSRPRTASTSRRKSVSDDSAAREPEEGNDDDSTQKITVYRFTGCTISKMVFK